MKILCSACGGAKRIKKPENLDLSDLFWPSERSKRWLAEGFIKCPCCKGKGTQSIDDQPKYQLPPPSPLGLGRLDTANPFQSFRDPLPNEIADRQLRDHMQPSVTHRF